MPEKVVYELTEEGLNKLCEKVARETADRIQGDVEALRHKMRIESGICYVRDLAWGWGLSSDAIRDRLKSAGVEPTSTGGRAHLYDVEEATEAIQNY